ncbi:hypothetical protein KA531_01790 [Candidatus Saccharibacteria bacterium]|nr:hypothetical protein [Candidatus Saccharibacteria bacterium]
MLERRKGDTGGEKISAMVVLSSNQTTQLIARMNNIPEDPNLDPKYIIIQGSDKDLTSGVIEYGVILATAIEDSALGDAKEFCFIYSYPEGKRLLVYRGLDSDGNPTLTFNDPEMLGTAVSMGGIKVIDLDTSFEEYNKDLESSLPPPLKDQDIKDFFEGGNKGRIARAYNGFRSKDVLNRLVYQDLEFVSSMFNTQSVQDDEWGDKQTYIEGYKLGIMFGVGLVCCIFDADGVDLGGKDPLSIYNEWCGEQETRPLDRNATGEEATRLILNNNIQTAKSLIGNLLNNPHSMDINPGWLLTTIETCQGLATEMQNLDPDGFDRGMRFVISILQKLQLTVSPDYSDL